MDSKRSHQQPKRRCPIPILPPRIPTPIPTANNNNNQHARSTAADQHHHNHHQTASLQMTLKQTTSTVLSSVQGAAAAAAAAIATAEHQATSGDGGSDYDQRSARFVSKTSYRLLDNDVKTAWINPRLISKINMEMIRTTEYQVPANIIAERNMNSHYYHNPVAEQQQTKQLMPQLQKQQPLQNYHHHHMSSHLKQSQQPVHNLQQRPAPLGGRDSSSSTSLAAHRQSQQESQKDDVGGGSWWESSSSNTGHPNGRHGSSAEKTAASLLPTPTAAATVTGLPSAAGSHSAQQQHSAADGGVKRTRIVPPSRPTPLGAPATKPTTSANVTMNCGNGNGKSNGGKLALKYHKKETVIVDAAKQTVVVMEQQQQHAVYRQHVLPQNAASNIPVAKVRQQMSSVRSTSAAATSGRYSNCDVVTGGGVFASATGVNCANGGVFGEGKYSYVSAMEELVAVATATGGAGNGHCPPQQPQLQLQYYPQVAQASAAAAFFARAAQKLNLSSSPHRRKRNSSDDTSATAESSSVAGCSTIPATGFCGVLQRSPPPVPPALLRRIGVREITGVGKVKVMLRISNPHQSFGSTSHLSASPSSSNSFFSLDKRKKQVTLVDPTCGTTAPEDRRVGVAAPKMFAFDAIFSQDDSQTEVCSSALSELIHAVINGSDGCLFCFGHAGLGKSYTMLGTPESANTLGVIPCAISWLFRGINEQKQKTGARFSVRVSAVEVCGPTNQLRDLLAGYANDSEQSPGVYLRDDPLFGNQPPHCELRVPTAEKAAYYLDAAVDCRNTLSNVHGHQRQPAPPFSDDTRDSHLLFTLHVYQYSVAGKGGVAGGRSRLHLIDLGNSERGKASGGIPLSGLGNILLAIFNGQKHLPYKEHKLTHLLKDCLSSLTCHAAMIAHVSPHAQNYTDTLTTVQLASRIHRMRRRRIKFVTTGTGNGSGGSSGEEVTRTTGTSSEPDPSSSDLSADTVIYVGPADDPTDGEHPPVYIPSLNSGDNRCVMSKALRGSSAEQRPPRVPMQKPTMHEVTSSPMHRSSVKNSGSAGGSKTSSPAHQNSAKSSPSRTASNLNMTSCKVKPQQSIEMQQKHTAGSTSDEQWIDGPRISKSKVAEARHFMKEPCHIKKRETWIDGPMQGEPGQSSMSAAAAAAAAGYGYMDTHKKNMIRQWVEHQTSQIQRTKYVTPRVQEHPTRKDVKELLPFKPYQEDEIIKPLDSCKKQDIVEESVIRTGLKLQKQPNDAIQEIKTPEENDVRIEEREAMENYKPSDDDDPEEEEEPVPIPPALPLIQPLSSREVSLESLDQLLKERLISNAEYNYQSNGYDQEANVSDDEDDIEVHDEDEILEIIEIEEPLEPVPMQDSCLQVTEEDIAFCMGIIENPLPEVDQENPLDHPLRILSQENLTVVSTFTDSMSIYTDLERILPRHRYDLKYGFYNDDYEDPDNPVNNYQRHDEKFEQLARLHELYSNRLAKANVANSETFQKQKQNLKRCESLSLADMLYGAPHDNSSIYSEPAYRPDQEKFCQNCQTSISRPATTQNWYMDPQLSASTTELSNPQVQTRPISGRFQRYTHRHLKDSNLAYLRHPDGASNPNLKEETNPNQTNEQLEPLLQQPAPSNIITKEPNFTLPLPPPSCLVEAKFNRRILSIESGLIKLTQKSEEYDSGHDSTPRTSKHSPAAISRKAESGYDSVVRDSESSSIDSDTSRLSTHNLTNRRGKCKHKQEKSFCSWFLNPFTCKYIEEPPETHF